MTNHIVTTYLSRLAMFLLYWSGNTMIQHILSYTPPPVITLSMEAGLRVIAIS